jgi:hypothetical protein
LWRASLLSLETNDFAGCVMNLAVAISLDIDIEVPDVGRK